MKTVMHLSIKQKLGQAFWETANQIALILLTITALFTADRYLFIFELILEIVYLIWACTCARYQRRAESQEVGLWSRLVDKDGLFLLDRVLLLVTAGGFVVILLFGFGKHLLTHPIPSLSHFAGWEAGALIWTGLFLFYYLVKFRGIGEQNIDRVLGGIFAVVCGVCYYKAWAAMGKPIEHAWFVFGIGLCLSSVELLTSLRHNDPKEQKLSWASFLWADMPMVVTFLTLIAYLYWHRDTEYPDVFVSGVIACQLLMSNTIFVVMEFGFLKLGHAASDRSLMQKTRLNDADGSLMQAPPPAA